MMRRKRLIEERDTCRRTGRKTEETCGRKETDTCKSKTAGNCSLGNVVLRVWKKQRLRPCVAICLACLSLILFLQLAAPAAVYAAYQSMGTQTENTFSLAAVCEFQAKLSPKLTAGNKSKMRLKWYVKENEGWKKIGITRAIPDDSAEALKKAELEVTVSFHENDRIYRYEISNEAGTVLSETFQLSVSKNGASVVCKKQPYEADLSDYRP